MSHKLVFYGNETLRQIAEDVQEINQPLLDLIETMYNIMYQSKGIGLSAPQVDTSRRLLILDLEIYNGPAMTLINPQIISKSEEIEPYEEGCLSLPNLTGNIHRPTQITIKALTPDEKEIRIDADGLLARVLQHEIDHLNGKLFIDHLENFLRKELTADLKKIKKLNRLS